jgi:ubiquinone/menaquinone biosynthesis C-methylase UbiE
MAEQLFTDGKAYERLMGRWSRLAGAAFLDWLNVPKAMRWLDAGCGNGAFTEEIIARCAPAEVKAIDPSEEQLAYARSRPGTKTAEFRAGDAQNLPFGDDCFDVGIMALVISFLPEPDKAAAELTRVVRRGGWVRPTCGIFRAEDRLCIPLTARSNRWAGIPRFRPIPWFPGAKQCESCGRGPG